MENKEIKHAVAELNDDALENVSGGNVDSSEKTPDLAPQNYSHAFHVLMLQNPTMSTEEILKLLIEKNNSKSLPENKTVLQSIARGQ